MSRHDQKGLRTWTWHFLIALWILMFANPQQSALGYFLGDIKAVLNGCEDHWTLQEGAAFPVSMTVCVNVRVVSPGPWIAFTYSSVHGLMPELGLEGDEGALYAWLLRVKHRFPLKLTQQAWHQVCLRRDVGSSSFSLEVDNQVVGHRVVIAQAIPSYGSLWLGCGQRDQAATPAPGQVELYLFRVWAGLEQHLPCEDGSVIGWSSQYWGVSSAKARKRDSDLPCAHRRLSHRRFRRQKDIVVPVTTTSPAPKKGLTCHIDQLCSNNNSYFWMPVTIESEQELSSEKDIHAFMSSVFACDGKGNVAANTRSDFDIFCLDVNHLQVENVSCLFTENKRRSQCGILLQLRSTVTVCKLRQAALSALQQTTGSSRMRANVTGAVERVGRNLCDGVDPSSGGFVTCSSSLSLEEMCKSKNRSTLMCDILKSDYVLNKETTTDSCTSETTHFCNCASFCKHQNHFYAQKLNVTNIKEDITLLQNILTNQGIGTCGVRPNSQCIQSLNVLMKQGLKKTYLNCQKIDERAYSCMMILEMNKPITDCSVITVLQTLINNTGGVTGGSLTHMVVCGDFDTLTDTLLTSNLTWFTSDLKTSDVCEASQTRLKCASNENLAVLLSDTCQSDPITTRAPSTTTTTTTTTQRNQAIPTTSSTTTTTQSTQTIPTTASTTTTTQTTAISTQGNATTSTTAAIPVSESTTSTQAVVQTTSSSTTPPNTLPNITHRLTHNTEVTTQLSPTQSELMNSKSTTISAETSQPSKATLENDKTTTTLVSHTESETKLETTTAKTDSTTKNEVGALITGSKPESTTKNEVSVPITASKPESTTKNEVSAPITGSKTESTTKNEVRAPVTASKTESTTKNEVSAPVTASKTESTTKNEVSAAVTASKPESTIKNEVSAAVTANKTESTIKNEVSAPVTANKTDSTIKNEVSAPVTANKTESTTKNEVSTAVTASKTESTTKNEVSAPITGSKTESITKNEVRTAVTASETESMTKTEVSAPVTASKTESTTKNEVSAPVTANKTESTTKNEVSALSANSIDTTTASTKTTLLNDGTKPTTASPTIPNTIETTTANKNIGNTNEASRTTDPIETTTASIRPETDKTAISNTFPTSVTAKTVDTTIQENTPSNASPKSFSNSTAANNIATTTSTDIIHNSPLANAVDNTTDIKIAKSTSTPSTIYTTTAASIISNTPNKANITSSTSSYTTTIANIAKDTTEVSTTTTSTTIANMLKDTTEVSTATISTMVVNATVAKTYQTSSSQTMVNSVTSTSDITNATLPTVAPNVSTIKSTAKTLTTPTTPMHITKTDSQPSTEFAETTNFNETLRIFIPHNETTVNTTTLATPITSTSISDTTETSFPSTTTDKTTSDAVIPMVSEATTFATTQATLDDVTTTQTSTLSEQTTKDTTSIPYSVSTQQMTVSTIEATSLPESVKTNTDTTQQATSNATSAETIKHIVNQTTTHNDTMPTPLVSSSNGSLVDSQTTTETFSMTISPAPSTTTVSSVTPNTTDTQSTAFTGSTVSSTRTIKYNVTTATVTSNISTIVTSNYTGVDKMLNNTVTGSTTITSTATIPTVSEMYNATTIGNKMTTDATLASVTTLYTPIYNTTKVIHGTDTTKAMATTTTSAITTNITTFTPITNHTTGYNVTKALYNETRKYNVSTTGVPQLNTTMPGDFTTIDSKNTSLLHATATTVTENATAAITMTPTQASIVTQNTTQAGMTTVAPTHNITAHLTTPSMNNMTIDAILNGTASSSTSIAPTSSETTASTFDNTTTSTTKPQVNVTTTVSTPGAVLSSQSTAIPTTTTTTTTTATTITVSTGTTTLGPQQTKESTTTSTNTTESFGTSLQVSTTSGTTNPDTGLIPTTSTEQTTRSQQELEEAANNLLSETADVSRLNSSQVSKLVGQLESLLDGPSVSQAVGEKAINIISNLMEGDAQALSASVNRLIRLVDNLGLKLEVSGENEILSSTSLVLAVQIVDASKFSTTTAEIFSTDNVQMNAGRSRSTGAPLGSVLLPASLTEGLSPDEELWASRVQFTFYTKSTLFMDVTLNNQTVVSPVLASSVANVSISNLKEDVEFTIRNVNPMKMNHSTSCVFWDFTENGGDGGWNNAGCYVIRATAEDTTCSCDHLTSFAVLLDLSREGITDRKQAQLLTFITYIGCGVSAVFLSVTILTYLSFEKLLRDIPAKILVQLCISLLLLNLVFLIDGWLALFRNTGLCISTAFFLHYFLLTSFTWAGLEALHMYLSIVRVFTPYLSKYMMKFSIMGWGIPLIVVIIIIAVDKNNYGLVTYGKYSDGTTDDFCWLRNDLAFYIGVVAYFLLIFTFCLIVFVVVLVQLARIKRQNPQNQSPNRGVLSDLRSISGLVILLGLTWGFALFAWGPLYLPFVYLFSIFNSLQGFFVFVFHCAVKENVQRQWRTYLCCGRLRLAENSEWSRTATHNHKNTSFTKMSSSAAHLTSSSASVVSEANSSGSVYADSGISDGSNSDVVMNEIHRRNMTRQGHL